MAEIKGVFDELINHKKNLERVKKELMEETEKRIKEIDQILKDIDERVEKLKKTFKDNL